MKSFARLDTEGQGWRRGIYEAEMSGCLWSSNTKTFAVGDVSSAKTSQTLSPPQEPCILMRIPKCTKRNARFHPNKSKEKSKTTKALLRAGLTRRMNLKAKLNVTLVNGISVLG